MVIIDDRGRMILPVEARRRLGIRKGSRVLLKVTSDNLAEIIVLDKLYEEVSKIFDEKFKYWKGEDHEASKILKMILGGDHRHSHLVAYLRPQTASPSFH
ncbi:MAG: AbrB/MazE/SpoVT family DNA-binding domain-containing protein [Candidatus Korarchaeota archaeon]|nr:AbrB/MazE/SpoVT family DNA-binding domain-containing protein [Candidatus Korarchaeota archaeon]